MYLTKILKSFSVLSIEDKKKKIITILEGLKENDDIFRQLLVRIKITSVDKKFLDDIYTKIIEFWVLVANHHSAQKTNAINQHLKRLQEIEKNEKESSDFIF